MWRRLRRRSFGPRNPVMWSRSVPLAVLSVAVLVVSAGFALYVVLVD